MIHTPTLTNGRLFVQVLSDGRIQNVYATHDGIVQNDTVGMSSQHTIGVLVDDTLTWLGDDGWETHQFTAQSAAVCHTRATHHKLGIEIAMSSAVDMKIDAFLRTISITNLAAEARRVQIFIQQVFTLGDSTFTDDTAQFLPKEQAILQYNGHRTIVIGARYRGHSFDACSIESRYATEMWRRSRALIDGRASLAESGQVDSIGYFTLNLDGEATETLEYWFTVGDAYYEAYGAYRTVYQSSVKVRMAAVVAHWRTWLATAQQYVERWSSRVQADFLHALLPLGSRLAESGVLFDGMASAQKYAYCRPYQTAAAYIPLVAMGYTKEIERFLSLCRKAMQADGYMPAVIMSNGAPGPMATAQTCSATLMDDYRVSTAAVLQLACMYEIAHRRSKKAQALYEQLITPLAQALSGQGRNDECHNNVSATASSMLRSALLQAAVVAEYRHDPPSAIHWRMSAESIEATVLPRVTSLRTVSATLQQAQQHITANSLPAADALIQKATQQLYTYGCLGGSLLQPSRAIDIAAHGEYIRTLLLRYGKVKNKR